MIDYPNREQYTADDLVRIIAILRDPENGCPWDKVQTHESIRTDLIEETYEVCEGIDKNSPEMLREQYAGQNWEWKSSATLYNDKTSGC